MRLHCYSQLDNQSCPTNWKHAGQTLNCGFREQSPQKQSAFFTPSIISILTAGVSPSRVVFTRQAQAGLFRLRRKRSQDMKADQWQARTRGDPLKNKWGRGMLAKERGGKQLFMPPISRLYS